MYREQTLTNRITGTRTAQVTKDWDAAALQAEFGDVKTEFTLQARVKAADGEPEAEWYDVDDNGNPVTLAFNGFLAETMSQTDSRSVSRYDGEGRELEYRWIETGVYQKGTEDNLLVTDEDGNGSFTLVQNGISRTYRPTYADVKFDEATGTYRSHITNHLEDTITYSMKKEWGKGVDPVPVKFYLYRMVSGTELKDLTEKDAYVTFTLNGEADSDWHPESTEEEGVSIRWKESSAWYVEIKGLPEFDENGYQYEYLLIEEESPDFNFAPHYYIRQDAEKNYHATVENLTGGRGKMILVRKQWVDDNDTLHREPVKVMVYAKENHRELLDTPVEIGDGGVWQKQVYISGITPDTEVYVREIQPEDVEGAENQGEAIDEGDRLETDHHFYEATYPPYTRLGGSTEVHTIKNRRLGKVDLTVTKEWVDGDGEIRKELADAVEKFNQKPENGSLHLAVRLKFAEDVDPGYKITYSGVDENSDTVYVGGATKVQIMAGDGKTPQSSDQEVILKPKDLAESDSQIIQFFGLPKYGANGEVIHYTVEEVWLYETTGADGNKSYEEYSVGGLTGIGGADEIYQLASLYSQSKTSGTYEVEDGSKHTSDTQEVTITNRLSGTKDLLWHKQWDDVYNESMNLRPDIYLNIYRAYHEEEDGEPVLKVERIPSNYTWDVNVVPEGEEGNELFANGRHWHVKLSNMPKYDALGYEILYYAVERSSVDTSAFDYDDVIYGVPKDGADYPEPGGGMEPGSSVVEKVGTAKSGFYEGKGPGNDDDPLSKWLLNLTDNSNVAGAADTGEDAWALAESGTFYNQIRKSVTIQGQKEWNNLPEDVPYQDRLKMTREVCPLHWC